MAMEALPPMVIAQRMGAQTHGPIEESSSILQC